MTVRLRVERGDLRLVVMDNGKGLPAETFAPAPPRLGLAGMRERIAALHGEVELEPAAGGGASLTVRLPASHVL